MNSIELKKKLLIAGVNTEAFCLTGGLPSEKYCLSNEAGRWSCYYSERGLRTGEEFFENENEACEYIYSILIKDPTTKR